MTLSAPDRHRPFYPNQHVLQEYDPHRGGPFSSLVLSLGTIITNTTATPNALPAAATVGAVIDVQGW